MILILINDVTFATKLCRAFQRIKNSTGYTSSGILVVIGTIIFFNICCNAIRKRAGDAKFIK